MRKASFGRVEGATGIALDELRKTHVGVCRRLETQEVLWLRGERVCVVGL